MAPRAANTNYWYLAVKFVLVTAYSEKVLSMGPSWVSGGKQSTEEDKSQVIHVKVRPLSCMAIGCLFRKELLC